MKKLRRDSLLADREAVKQVLGTISNDDPLGLMSFEARLEEIEQEIASLDHTVDARAEIALTFAGEPVEGSRAIDADFSAKVLSTFQDLVTKRVANVEFGALGGRGPVRMRADSSLSIRELVRGSMGFVLEEADSQSPLFASATRAAIDEVADIIASTASTQDTEFESAVEALDPRLLGSLREFFHVLDERRAVIRMVEGDHDYKLDAAAVRRGRQRVDMIEINEEDSDTIIGELFGVFPASRQFEMRLREGQVIKGRVSAEMAQKYVELIEGPDQGIVGRLWRTKMRIREVKERNKPPRKLYLLLGLLQPVE